MGENDPSVIIERKERLDMSQSAVEQVVGKMLLDADFRQQMASDIDQALRGYDLTEEEIEGLKNIDLEDFHQSVSGMDERVSKGISIN
jgi:hypothetical protein